MVKDFKYWTSFRGADLLRTEDQKAYRYTTNHTAADADGAPNAYHPGDKGKSCKRDRHIGLDCLGNAGYPDQSWWPDVLVQDPNDPSKAYEQVAGPYAGFFVAKTALRDRAGDPLATATYVDSTLYPYIVLPSGIEKIKGIANIGDVGFALHISSGKMCAYIVGDSGGGSEAKLGEASIAFYAALGFPNCNPRTGAGLPHDDIEYTVFPGSRPAPTKRWPRTRASIEAQVAELKKEVLGIQ